MPIYVSKAGTGSEKADVTIEFRGLAPEICSILLNPKTRPPLFNEAYISGSFAQPPPDDYSGNEEVIDEPLNAGDFYIHRGISTGGIACTAGAIVLVR